MIIGVPSKEGRTYQSEDYTVLPPKPSRHLLQGKGGADPPACQTDIPLHIPRFLILYRNIIFWHDERISNREQTNI